MSLLATTVGTPEGILLSIRFLGEPPPLPLLWRLVLTMSGTPSINELDRDATGDPECLDSLDCLLDASCLDCISRAIMSSLEKEPVRRTDGVVGVLGWLSLPEPAAPPSLVLILVRPNSSPLTMLSPRSLREASAA